MVRSMTAFGRARGEINGKKIIAEIKSVNNRYLDCQVKLPRAYAFLEEKIKALAASRISRGKVEISISIENTESTGAAVALDEAYARSYIDALFALRDHFALTDDITVMGVAANRDIFTVTRAEEDAERDWEDVKGVLESALDDFISFREKEGMRLRDDLTAKKQTLERILCSVEERSGECIASYKNKLEDRLHAILEDNSIDLNEQRILTECAIFADRVAIDEETVRLRSHLQAFDEMLLTSEPVGRKLDFLLQEMNRETNTIGSKAQDTEIARDVIEMKNELEKIREQIQNLE